MKRPSADTMRGNRPAGPPQHKETPLRQALRAALLALLVFISWSAILLFYPSPERVRVVVGEPAPRDIKAPRQLTYLSNVKTQEARASAAAKVEDVYVGPDLELMQQQLQYAREITAQISTIRQDQAAGEDEKIAALRELTDFPLSAETIQIVLALSEPRWQGVITETLRVLEATLREEIRPNQLLEARRRATRLIRYTLPADEHAVVNALLQNLIVANTFYDTKQTALSREAARNAVEPVYVSIRAGESILREGEIATALALEKLQVLNLLQASITWQDRVGVMLFAAVLVISLSVYVVRSQPLLLGRPRRELLFVLILVLAGLAARAAIPGRTLLPYLFPTAAISMLVAILLDVHLAMFTSALMAVLVGFNAGGSIELTVLALMGGVVGGLAIWRMDNLAAFVRAALYVALANIAVILAFRLPNQTYDAVGLLQLLATGVANAILSSSLTFVTFSLIGRLFGITTSLQLLELARPTHPLFKQLLTKAPGTYHHSIITSNMAERAAEAIGADALLARVGSYYHDIGKTARPYFFAENQNDGENPHDRLDPRTSAEIIIAHTADGLALARKYGLPDKVRDFIAEHHGTNLVTYFYRRANQENPQGPVNEELFRYPGPKPQSKETAIVMLADSIEAWVRANRPATQAEMERVIRQVINDRLVSGQLDECDLTLRDLDKIREAFSSVLQGIFHPRVQYPEKAPQPSRQETPPAS